MMTTAKRSLVVAATATFGAAAAAWAQTPVAASPCTNNLKQIGLGLHDSPVKASYTVAPGRATGGETLVPGPHPVALCSDGTSKTIMLGERLEAASLRGCPADIDARGLGQAEVRARERPDGALEVSLVSREHRGCQATAMFANTQFMAARLGPAADSRAVSEPDGRRVPAHVRRGFSAFWSGLAPADADALERRLGALEARARRGANVDRELAVLRTEYPQLFELSKGLQGEWHLVGPDGAEEGSAECKGIGWQGKNGKLRCIGHLVVND